FVVETRREPKSAPLPRALDRPAREGARDLGNVLLRVATVDAERVQLHQLAAVVLVEALRRVLARRARLWEPREIRGTSKPPAELTARAARLHHVLMRAVRIGAHPVIQVEEHRGAFRVRFEQVAELAEDMGRI